ncbi:MAG: SH3 domain-containing protein [Paludibacteraceae bacterium]|jgi:hypothetical protein|nr:SH3 domain-containing protein [Paludibacteraceae bacterium]
MRREFLIMAMLFTAFQLFAQKYDLFNVPRTTAKEFNDFLNRFPKKEWKDLDSLGKKEWEDLNHSDTISAYEANKNITWLEGSCYVCFKKEKTDRYKKTDLFYSYRQGHLGMFDYPIYPLGQIDLYEGIVLLVAGYRYSIEVPNYLTEFSVDCYVLNKSEMRQTTCFSLNSSEILDDMRIFSFEYYEGTGEEKLERYVYQIRPNGVLYEIDDVIYEGVITDPTDDYVNIRKRPDLKSEIKRTIGIKSTVKYIEVPNSNWVEILLEDKKNSEDRADKSGGYVHKSRVKKTGKMKQVEIWDTYNGDEY